MPIIQVRGVDHFYEWITAGDRSTTQKPVLLFLHGWAGSGRYWETTAHTFTDQFDCLLYDLRGFGRSLLPKTLPADAQSLDYELETYADDLAALLDALNLDRVYLNAHSTGASIAVLFLNRYPERVEKAILTCNGVFEYDEKAFAAFYQFGGYVVAFRPQWLAKIPFVDRMFIARFLHRPLPSSVSKAFLEDFLLASPEAALGTIFTAVSKKMTEVMPQEYAALTTPTLLISGQYDKIIPAELGRKAALLNPKIEHVVIPNTAHFPMLEDPETYLGHVRAFLKEAGSYPNG